jgi:23S rRNA (guanine745-N1)-methyltransferase
VTDRRTSPGLDGVLPLLACPHCSGALGRDHGVVGCSSGHRFDIARQGYLSLLGSTARTDTADSAAMVAARAGFLATGHYRAIADALADQVEAGPVLEVGAGTGYYLGVVLDRMTGALAPDAVGLALDSSRYAARRAAAAHPRIGSIVADAWSRLPIRDGVVGAVLSVFAPRDPAEIVRVLAPGGRVLVVTPEPDHLVEIRATLGLLTVDAGKPERLAAAFGDWLRPACQHELRRTMRLTPADVDAVAGMGPSARHIAPDRQRAAVAELADVTDVTLAVTVTVLQS